MAGGDLGTYAVPALGYHGIAEAYHVYALLEHSGGELVGYLGVIEHYGDYGMLAGQQVEAALFHLGAEVAGIFVYLVPEGGALGQHIDGLAGRGADSGGNGI